MLKMVTTLTLESTLKSESTLVHEKAMLAAQNYKRSEIELLEAISRVEEKQIYLVMDITSLFQYCVEMLGLSRHVSFDLITVMRKAKEVPALREAIARGDVTLSKARRISSVITVKNQAE